MAKLIRDENLLYGLPPSDRARGRKGITNVDAGQVIEQGFTLPWTSDPVASYIAYDCWIEILLDAGIAIHRPLPQTNPAFDTLATVTIDDRSADSNIKEINTVSNGKFTDTSQRMAHSIYRFALKGYGMRAGYTIPIPGMKTACGVPAIPEERQWAYTKIVGNWSGVPIFLAEWDLHYSVLLPPRSAQETMPNLALHIRGNQQLPKAMQVPYSVPDTNARRTSSGN